MMNNRIKELAKKSRKVVGHTDGGYTEITVLDEEKFAKLIVKDCINCIKNERSLGEYSLAAKNGMEIAISSLKEHFGV